MSDDKDISNESQPQSEPSFENDGERDRLEGRYNEVDGEAEPVRTVHGQYTETSDQGPDPVHEGSYTDANDAGATHLTEERHGKFNRTEQ